MKRLCSLANISFHMEMSVCLSLRHYTVGKFKQVYGVLLKAQAVK